MRNVLHKSCRENENTHFMFNNVFFRKSHRLGDNVEKYRPRNMSQYGAYALRAGIERLYAHKNAHAPGYPHARTHARTRKHAHTDQYVILTAFPRQQLFRERASVLRYSTLSVLLIYTLLRKKTCSITTFYPFVCATHLKIYSDRRIFVIHCVNVVVLYTISHLNLNSCSQL
jgi:hypothetical protein